jgi:hypothetical protein
MKLTRVAAVKDSNCERKRLAQFELCRQRLRAAYLGRIHANQLCFMAVDEFVKLGKNKFSLSLSVLIHRR